MEQILDDDVLPSTAIGLNELVGFVRRYEHIVEGPSTWDETY